MRIALLPLAGRQNPYQYLTAEGLREAGLEAVPGLAGRWFALTRTQLVLRPQVVHLDWPGSYYLRRSMLLSWLQYMAFWADLALAGLLGMRLCWTMHNLAEHDGIHPHLDHRAKRALARAAWRIRVFAPGQKEEAAAWLAVELGKVVAIPEGPYTSYYPTGATRPEALTRLGLPPVAGKRLLFVGNLRPYKGVDRLIQIFIQEAGPEDALLIAGPAHSPGYVAELIALAGSDSRIVLRPGLVADADLQYYFAASDVVMLPFGRITNSGTVILAMGFGLPVVAPRVGAVATRLASQPGDLLYNPTSVDGLSLALQAVLAYSSVRLAQIGAANARQVDQTSWRVYGDWLKGQQQD